MYLWDWSSVTDIGYRLENFVACHLLKAIHYWEDMGLGEYGLYFVGDKSKRETDFLVVRNSEPWFLVEVKKSSKRPLSKDLCYFQSQLKEVKDIADIWILATRLSFSWREIIDIADKKSPVDPLEISKIIKSLPQNELKIIKWQLNIDCKEVFSDLQTIANDILLGQRNTLGIL